MSSTQLDLKVVDEIESSAQYRAQSVTTTASEALGGATVLVTRRLIIITPTTGPIYWGTTAGVTIATGQPIFKNQTFVISINSIVRIYLIAAATTDVRVLEAG